MNTLKFRAVATAAVALALAIGSGAAAQAEPLPEGPLKLYLKEHAGTPLGETDGTPHLTADYDHWHLRPVEALQGLGGHHIVHVDSGRCLTADTGGGEEVVPVALADCADAVAWSIVYDDRDAHQDFRLLTPDGYYLGTETDPEESEGTTVFAVRPESGESLHFQEWLLAAAPVETTPPPSPSPSEEAPPSSESESPKPTLPTTGTALGASVGAGVVALAGGTALVLWWQRRRALRADW